MTTLASVIDTYLGSIRPKENLIPMTIHFDEDTDTPKFRVSDAGRCRLYRFWKRQGKERTQPDAKGLRLMEAGNMYHAWLSYALHESGVLVDSEIEVENEHSKGHADAIVLLDDTYILYDFKTISSKQAGYMLSNGCKTKKEHSYQILSYYFMIDNGAITIKDQRMTCLMSPQECRIAYITREEMEIIAELPVDPDLLPQVKKDWQILISAWEKQAELWKTAVKQNDGHPPTAKEVIKVIEIEFEEKKPKYVPQIDPKIERNLPPKPTPTPNQLKTIIKAFMGIEFSDFTEAFEELGHLCTCWQSREPYVSLVNRLKSTIEFSYTLPEFHFTVRDACRGAYNEWEELYKSGYRRADKPEEKSKPQPETPEQTPELKSCQEASGAWCLFCQQDFPKEKLYWSNRTAICRQCAAKAHIALLHTDDPEVIADECQQSEQDYIHDFQPRRTRDLEKILRTGSLRIFYVSEHERIIKQFTRAKSTTAEGVHITLGSWKTFEKFDTKKAMMDRVKELEQESDVIFDGRI